MSSTIAFSEKNNGWIGFFDFKPGLMCKLNNRFYTIKDGQLYLHNDKANTTVNEFYGVRYASKIATIINEAPSEDKIFKNIIQEASSPWKTTIETNLSSGVIEADEFNERESKWMAHTRKNESSSDLNDRVQGIGNIISIDGSDVTFGAMPTLVSVGETLFQLNNNVQEEIGEIINIQGNVITVGVVVNAPVVDLFSYSVKNARVQGAEIRGYYAKLTLENDDNGNSELFAVSSNIAQSFVPTDYK